MNYIMGLWDAWRQIAIKFFCFLKMVQIVDFWKSFLGAMCWVAGSMRSSSGRTLKHWSSTISQNQLLSNFWGKIPFCYGIWNFPAFPLYTFSLGTRCNRAPSTFWAAKTMRRSFRLLIVRQPLSKQKCLAFFCLDGFSNWILALCGKRGATLKLTWGPVFF